MKKFAWLLLVIPWFLGLALLAVAEPAQEKPPQPKKRATGLIRPPAAERAKMHQGRFRNLGFRMKSLAATATPPAAFDCVAMGWVPPVRDQGSCGSCYLVSTCDQVTCAWIKAGYAKADDSFKISDQYGMDCHNFGGCNGGWGVTVVAWMIQNGFPAERYLDASGVKIQDYPGYSAQPQNCRAKTNAKSWKPLDWGYATADQSDRLATSAEIKAAMMQYGVLNFALDAGGAFSNYQGGVIESLGQSINHEITMVGWDDSKGKAGAWKCRNQWSTDWGENGYVWIGYGAYIVDVFWVSVPPLPAPPVGIPVVSSGSFSGQVGKALTYQIIATNTDGPTEFAAAPLPAGLYCAKYTGLISGTPATTGTTDVALSVTNASGTGTGKLALTVTGGPTPPTPSGPIASAVITFADGSTQTLMPAVTAKTTLGELAALMARAQGGEAPAKVKMQVDDGKWLEQAKVNEAFLRILAEQTKALEALKKELTPKAPPAKTPAKTSYRYTPSPEHLAWSRRQDALIASLENWRK